MEVPNRRIGRLRTHLTGNDANDARPVPLTDEEVKQFIVAGFLVKKIDDLPREFHLDIYEKCVTERRTAAQESGKSRLQGGQEASHVAALDDFIFPIIPELGQVYASPVFRGATASLAGEDYCMHPHRHMHSGMGGMDQNFHKGIRPPCSYMYPIRTSQTSCSPAPPAGLSCTSHRRSSHSNETSPTQMDHGHVLLHRCHHRNGTLPTSPWSHGASCHPIRS
jgi:hypothetical protein